MGKYKRTPESLEKLRTNRKNKGCGLSNGMASEENRKKVSQSKVGRKIYINEDGIKKYCIPGTEPAGFLSDRRKYVYYEIV
jgi:hypothetical protein